MSNKLDLNWHTFTDHVLDNMKHLLSSNQFADVTLVCDDNIRIMAHSFVLSACSAVFSNLFKGESQSNATVFLRGIDHRDLNQILQFMYQGKATFAEDRMNSFISASKSLEVKEISTGFADQKEDETLCEDNQGLNKDVESDTTNHVSDDTVVGPEQYIVTTNTPVQPVPEVTNNVANSTGSNVCPECEKIFHSSSNMKKHYMNKHQGVTFPCDQCNMVYRHQERLTTHKRAVHDGQTIICEYEGCGKEYNFRLSYRQHVDRVHNNILYNCTECDFKTACKKHLKMHKESKHEGIRFECNRCGKLLSSKQNLEKHYKFFHDGITQKCSEESCNMEFANTDSLNRHIEGVHRNVGYPCSLCDYQATRMSYLNDHIQTKHQGIRYECLECGKHFMKQSSLNLHFQTIHEGIKNHECNQCDYKTAFRHSLKKHIIAIHEEQKNYECDQCDFKTAHKSYLKRHIDTHEGVRFSCEECGKCYSTREVLKRHKKALH